MLSNNNLKINQEAYEIKFLSQFKKEFEKIKNYKELKILLM